MLQTNYKPCTSLLPYIDRYWACNSDTKKDTDLFPLFAGTGVDLFIDFDTPFLNADGLLSSSHIFCPRRTQEIKAGNSFSFLAVRFRCGAFRHFCSVNFSELNNGFWSVEDIWGREGWILISELYEKKDYAQRINVLDFFFRKQFDVHNKGNNLLDVSIADIYTNYDDVAIENLAKDLHISLRHFERLFKEEFGISPKKFQVISRFQSTVKTMLLSSANDYLQIALDNGYYDQSHFIRECRALCDLSPSGILKMKDEKTHFFFHKYMPASARL